MISIDRNRVNCPPQLDTSKNNLVEGAYKHGDVIDALLNIQHSKCCYCEKDLMPLGKTARSVDHFVARTDNRFKDTHGNTNWNKANAWENLLYACITCNRSKGTTPPFDLNGERKLIDPSYRGIDPEDHVGFRIDGVVIIYKERTSLGNDTIEILRLDKRIDVYSGFRHAQRDIDGCFGELVNALLDGKDITAESKRADLAKMSSAHLPHASFRRKYIIQKVNRFNNYELQEINQQYRKDIQPITVDVANRYEVIQ